MIARSNQILCPVTSFAVHSDKLVQLLILFFTVLVLNGAVKHKSKGCFRPPLMKITFVPHSHA